VESGDNSIKWLIYYDIQICRFRWIWTSIKSFMLADDQIHLGNSYHKIPHRFCANPIGGLGGKWAGAFKPTLTSYGVAMDTYLSRDCLRTHVTVSNRCHGDCRPPERSRDACIAGFRHLLLGKEGKAGEDYSKLARFENKKKKRKRKKVEGEKEKKEKKGL